MDIHEVLTMFAGPFGRLSNLQTRLNDVIVEERAAPKSDNVE